MMTNHEVTNSPPSVDIDLIASDIKQHIAFTELRKFGMGLLKHPLSAQANKTFFATLRAFFQDIPVGILSLAVRVSDDWARFDPYEATAKGAYILFADVDEFGLHEHLIGMLPTHHQLFRNLAEHMGITTKDLSNDKYVLTAGVALGKRTAQYYRQEPIPEALGFHLASETTSQREFVYFLKGYQQHQAHYGLTGDSDPVLDFFRVHTFVEPMHKSRARELIELYLVKESSILPGVRRGAIAFMDGFADLFSALNKEIFGAVDSN